MHIRLRGGGRWSRRLSLAWNVTVLVVTAYVSAAWANAWVDSLRDYRPPLGLLEGTAAGRPAGRALTDGVVLVLLEGVPADYLDRMSALQGLSTARVRMAGRWSETTPASGWIALVSGATPRLAGAPLQDAAGGVPWYSRVETLFDVTADAGRPTALYGPLWWQGMVPADKRTSSVLFGSAGEAVAISTLDEACRQLGDVPPALTLVHVRWPDGVHTTSLDAALRRLLKNVDFSRRTLLLVTLPAKGNAQMTAVGRGIRPGVYAGMRAVDAAPTTAALLGMPVPARSEGMVFRSLLEWDIESEARALASLAEARWELTGAYLAGMGSSLDTQPLLGEREAVRRALEAGTWPAAKEQAEKLIEELDGLMEQAYRRRVWHDRLWRLWLPALYLAGAVLVQGRSWRRRTWPLAPALMTAAVAGLPTAWLALTQEIGLLVSFATWMWGIMGLACVGMLAGMGGMWALRQESWDIGERWRRAFGLIQLAMAVWGMPLAFLMWWQGLMVWWDLPAAAGAVAQAVLLAQVAGLSMGGLAGVLAAPFLKD
ncbi:MAG: hypothetical protein ACUVWB_04505 [Anaerolineae bacterium]